MSDQRQPAPVHPLAQSDGMSCGAMVAQMTVRALGFHPDLALQDFSLAVGTNQRTGTVPRGLLDGFAGLGVTATFERPGGTARLKSLVRGEDGLGPKYALLRVLIGAGTKHWILCDGVALETGHLHIVDPGPGERTLRSASEIDHIWRSRSWDSVLVPATPGAHLAARMVPLQPRDVKPPPGPVPVHLTRIEEWCGGREIIPTRGLDERRRDRIAAVRNAIRRAANDLYLARLPWASPRYPDLRFSVEGGRGLLETMVVQHQDAAGRLSLVAGIEGGTTWVAPSERGLGIGAEMLLAAHAHQEHLFAQPDSFSVDGYRARLSAHRRGLIDAMDAGLDVPASVLAPYDLTGPELILRDPAWEAAWQEAEATGRPVLAPGLPMGPASAG